MSGFDFDQSESIENSLPYLREAGKYHVVVTGLDSSPATRDGRPLDGLRVECEVLAGTTEKQNGKTFETLLFRGKATDKDGGQMANKKLTRLALAFGGQHSPGGKGRIDTETCIGRQIVIDVAKNTGKDGKERVEINYSNIYHVDDPEVADVPKDASALGVIPRELRKLSPTSAVPMTSTTTSVPAVASAVSLDDI